MKHLIVVYSTRSGHAAAQPQHEPRENDTQRYRRRRGDGDCAENARSPLQDVPVSITAITGEDLTVKQIDDVQAGHFRNSKPLLQPCWRRSPGLHSRRRDRRLRRDHRPQRRHPGRRHLPGEAADGPAAVPGRRARRDPQRPPGHAVRTKRHGRRHQHRHPAVPPTRPRATSPFRSASSIASTSQGGVGTGLKRLLLSTGRGTDPAGLGFLPTISILAAPTTSTTTTSRP